MATIFIKWSFQYFDDTNLVRVIGEVDDTPLSKIILICKAEELLEKSFNFDVNIVIHDGVDEQQNFTEVTDGKAVATFQIMFSDNQSMKDYIKMMTSK